MLVLAGLEVGAWGVERMGYVEMAERRGSEFGKTVARWHKIARWGLPLLAVPVVVLIVLISA
jgi:hypothetical protein